MHQEMSRTTAARCRSTGRRCLRWSMRVLGISCGFLGLTVACAPSAYPSNKPEYEAVAISTSVTYDQPIGPVQQEHQCEVSDLVLGVVYHESGGEPYDGQVAVAQTIYESSVATGRTPEEVVTAKNAYASPKPIEEVSDSVRQACHQVFCLREGICEQPIRYFYSTAGGFYSEWHETSDNLEYVTTIGAHKFYMLKEV